MIRFINKSIFYLIFIFTLLFFVGCGDDNGTANLEKAIETSNSNNYTVEIVQLDLKDNSYNKTSTVKYFSTPSIKISTGEIDSYIFKYNDIYYLSTLNGLNITEISLDYINVLTSQEFELLNANDFKKTKSGYKFNGNKEARDKYVKYFFADQYSLYGDEYLNLFTDLDLQLTVSEGIITKITVVGYTGNNTENELKYEYTFSNLGSTTVEIPEEIINKVK